MEVGLRRRKALITGAAREIGRASAEALAAKGCDVVLVPRASPLDLSDSRNVDHVAEESPDTAIPTDNAVAIPRGTIVTIDGGGPIRRGPL